MNRMKAMPALVLLAHCASCALPPNLRSPDLRDGARSEREAALDADDDAGSLDASSDVTADQQAIDAEPVDTIDVLELDQQDSAADAALDSADTPAPDTGVDTGIDVRSDTGSDTGVDTGSDTGVDTGVDVPNDVRPDVTCLAPTMACGGACVDVLSSSAHCGACGRACTGASGCVAGGCRSVNDRCAAATVLGTDPVNRTFFGTLRGATVEPGDCTAAVSTVFYSWTVTAPSLVYASVTSNTSFRPKVAFRARCSATSTCGSDGCNDLRFEQSFAYVNSGTVYLEVGSTTAGDGDFTLTVSTIRTPVNNLGGVSEASALPVAATYDRTQTLVTTTTASTVCGGLGMLPGMMLFWLSCPTSPGGSLVASTCFPTRALDTVLEYRSATGDTTCIDDVGASACGPSIAGAGVGAELDHPIARGANLHTVTLRQKTASPYNTGVVRLTLTRPPGI